MSNNNPDPIPRPEPTISPFSGAEMTTTTLLGYWFNQGVAQGAAFMIVACDTFDYDDYPVYVEPGKNPHDEVERIRNSSMQTVMEVYDLSLLPGPQLVGGTRVHNYGDWKPSPPQDNPASR